MVLTLNTAFQLDVIHIGYGIIILWGMYSIWRHRVMILKENYIIIKKNKTSFLNYAEELLEKEQKIEDFKKKKN